MIRVGDKLMFRTKDLNDLYGHNEPVEVVDLCERVIAEAGKGFIKVRVWEPYLYYGQQQHQKEMMFHASQFLLAGCPIPGPSWFERLLDKVFG